MNKTTLIINEFAAADKLEKEMEQFGLEVDRGTFTGTYPGTTTELYNVCVYTKKYPVNNTTENNLTVKTATIVRTVCLFLALVNQLLTASGHSALPIADEEVATIISTVITVAVAVWNWWKNNSFTKNAIAADAYMDELKKSAE